MATAEIEATDTEETDVVTVKIKDIVFDESIYPRSGWDKDTIKFYMERLMAGEKPPPSILEPETNRLLDGKHRYEAKVAYARWYKHDAKEEEREAYPEPTDEVEVKYQEIPEGSTPRLWCAYLNINHGNRISDADRRRLARATYIDNPKTSQGEICTSLGCPQTTVSDWIKDLRAKENQKREWNLEILRRLGWTQAEIGEAVGLGQPGVRKALLPIPDSVKVIKTQLAKTHQIQEVAEAYNMPLILATALDLDRVRDDWDRAKQLGVTIRPIDAWMFSGCRDLFGCEGYPGRIPGDLVFNVLYFYTQQNDIVLDPMAGSGTVADVCLVMDRRCYCYDIANEHDRVEIRDHDLYRDGWPPRTENADLIFWDPPYFSKMDGTQVNNGYGEKSISRLDRDDYLGFFSRSLKLAYEVSKDTCKLALLMADWYDYDDPGNSVNIFHYNALLRDAGWQLTRWFEIPQTTHASSHIFDKYCLERKLASAIRYLFVVEKAKV